ncbi:MAG: type I methionyl aminopeptidase [Candidatus Omnitrophica bacterium]|nr:type I methionyl aminopeptidase [Candidatus Omnitrophota bacterium]
MIELKNAQEIEQMRTAGRVVAGMLQRLAAMVAPGLKTKRLDAEAARFLEAHHAAPAFLGYRGFPATVCVSINEEVVHGIPGDRTLRAGDVVSIDAGAVVEGFYADAAITVGVGDVAADARRLMETTRRALAEGIALAKAGRRVSDISHAVQQVVEQQGFGVVRDFVGHGIGRALHEDPPIPNFGPPDMGPRLDIGMVLAIEPMVTMGGFDVEVLRDGWTAVTKDRSWAAHFEHTVAITERGAEILTAVNSP